MNRKPLLRPNVHEPIPAESTHPSAYTARIRAHLLTDSGDLMTQRIRQAEYRLRCEEAEHAPQDARTG